MGYRGIARDGVYYCRCSGGEEQSPYRNVQRNTVASIKRLCKVVNQTMLLQKLHDTRICDQLLEQDTTEGSWKPGQGSGSDAVLSRAKSVEGMSAWKMWVFILSPFLTPRCSSL